MIKTESLESFCNQIWGAPYAAVLQRITKDEYRQFEIPKKQGTRTIQYVDTGSELWQLQHALLKQVLEKEGLPACAKGFRKGGDYRAFLSEHIGAKFFMRIDIAAFFPSISSACVKDALAPRLACGTGKDLLLDLLCDIVTLDGRLPQGACTSPAVSNLVMAKLDLRIDALCRKQNICYTRYADDLLFSSTTFNFDENRRFIKQIKYILRTNHLHINYDKLKFGRDEMVLNGYVISGQGIRLSRNRLSDIRHTVAFAQNYRDLLVRFGGDAFLMAANRLPLKHRDLQTRPFADLRQFVFYLRGYRAFLISMLDGSFAPSQKQLRRLLRRIDAQAAFCESRL